MNIIDYIPYGRANAISRQQLCLIAELSDREVRKQIEAARKDYAILNAQDGSGYFRPLPEEMPLVEAWIRQERSREHSVHTSTIGAERLIMGLPRDVIPVSAYVRRKSAASDKPQIEGQIRL